MPWAAFTAWGLLGEVVWVGFYVALGWAFAGNPSAASDLALNLLGLVGAAVLALGLGAWLRAAHRTGTARSLTPDAS